MSFVILFGTISLFSDMTYEGGRSLSGQYLKILGASAAAVGIAAGAGEFLGYGLRFFSGYIADRTGKYWLVTFIGYIIQLGGSVAKKCVALSSQSEFPQFIHEYPINDYQELSFPSIAYGVGELAILRKR